jgi:hypothetical protein
VRKPAEHGTQARWNNGCSCGECRRGHSDIERVRKRASAQKRLPVEVRQQLLDAIYEGQPFRQTLRDLGLTSNQVFGLARTDDEWSEQLEGIPGPVVCPHGRATSVVLILGWSALSPQKVRRTVVSGQQPSATVVGKSAGQSGDGGYLP